MSVKPDYEVLSEGTPSDGCDWELGDELDLHTFRPKDIKSLVPDYLDECVERGFTQVRIIHGKGKGVQRRVVHAALERHRYVQEFSLGEPGAGGWGATIVILKGKSK